MNCLVRPNVRSHCGHVTILDGLIGRLVGIFVGRGADLEAESLARRRADTPARPSDHLVDAPADVLLHVARDGTLLDSRPVSTVDGQPHTRPAGSPRRTATSIGDLLGPRIAARVIENVQRALDTRTVVYDVWEANDVSERRPFVLSGPIHLQRARRGARAAARRDDGRLSPRRRTARVRPRPPGHRRDEPRRRRDRAERAGRAPPTSSAVGVASCSCPTTATTSRSPTCGSRPGCRRIAPARLPGRRNWLAEFVDDSRRAGDSRHRRPARRSRRGSAPIGTTARRSPRIGLHPARLRRRAPRRHRDRLLRRSPTGSASFASSRSVRSVRCSSAFGNANSVRATSGCVRRRTGSES